MKKNLFVMLFFIAASTCGYSQVNVDTTTGHVSIGTQQPLSNTSLNVEGYYYSGFRHAINAYLAPLANGLTNTSISTTSVSSTTLGTGRSIGVMGLAGGYTSGYNYGILGGISSITNGAGVFGTVSNHNGVYVNGKYAGYFDGPTYCNNTVTANSFVTLSDIRLKENVSQLSAITANGSTLENLMNMNVITYNFKDREIPAAERDTISAELAKTMYATPKTLHYGLSAQELQEIYPDLVQEGQDGFLGVNYTELVPILIRSIQELKQEVDALKSASAYAARPEDKQVTGMSSNVFQGVSNAAVYDLQGHALANKTVRKDIYVQKGKKYTK